MIDVQRAIRYVRYHAQTWNIDPDKIGIMGFSAGGHLASMASTFYSLRDDLQSDPIDRESSRPSLQILIYPVIDFSISYRVVSAVLGHDPFPSKQMLMNLSTHLSVKFDAPPAFIVHSTMDILVPIENSMRYVDALRKANVSVDFHSKDFGSHGFGMYLFETNAIGMMNGIFQLSHGFIKNLFNIIHNPKNKRFKTQNQKPYHFQSNFQHRNHPFLKSTE